MIWLMLVLGVNELQCAGIGAATEKVWERPKDTKAKADLKRLLEGCGDPSMCQAETCFYMALAHRTFDNYSAAALYLIRALEHGDAALGDLVRKEFDGRFDDGDEKNRAEAEKYKKVLGTLNFKCVGPTVFVDGQLWSNRQGPIRPGQHTIKIKDCSSDYVATLDVDVGKGQTVTVGRVREVETSLRLDIQAPPPSHVSTSTTSTKPTGSVVQPPPVIAPRPVDGLAKWDVAGGVVVGAALVAAGVVLGLLLRGPDDEVGGDSIPELGIHSTNTWERVR